MKQSMQSFVQTAGALESAAWEGLGKEEAYSCRSAAKTKGVWGWAEVGAQLAKLDGI